MTVSSLAASSVTPPLDVRPGVEHLVTEDDTPVDNLFSEKQQRLLTEPLYASWPGPGEALYFFCLFYVFCAACHYRHHHSAGNHCG